MGLHPGQECKASTGLPNNMGLHPGLECKARTGLQNKIGLHPGQDCKASTKLYPAQDCVQQHLCRGWQFLPKMQLWCGSSAKQLQVRCCKSGPPKGKLEQP
eukprot:1158871-Pelagomonas_calceolata.AAC.3